MTFELKQSLYKPLPASDAEAQRLTAARERIRASNEASPASAADIAIAQRYQYANEAERNAARNGRAQAAAAEAETQTPRPDVFDAPVVQAKVEPVVTAVGDGLGRAVGEGVSALGTGAKAIADAVSDTVRDPRGTTDGVVQGATHAAERFRSNLNAGSITGGLLGAGGAFIASSMFGPGPLKMLLMLLLIPAGMMLGAGKLGGPLNNFFSGIFGNRNREGHAPARQPDAPQQQATQQQAEAQQPETEQQQPAPLSQLSREDLRRARVAVPSSVARSVGNGALGEQSDIQSLYEAGFQQGLLARIPQQGAAPVGNELSYQQGLPAGAPQRPMARY